MGSEERFGSSSICSKTKNRLAWSAKKIAFMRGYSTGADQEIMLSENNLLEKY